MAEVALKGIDRALKIASLYSEKFICYLPSKRSLNLRSDPTPRINEKPSSSGTSAISPDAREIVVPTVKGGSGG